ncbi:FtsQ-type POTRA domain-containing protein [Pseudarthrobacter psychrotolerans]|uniref:FtsQ-type POTRA domain-containing protein n=1 Tax=Pseudarthrobacter psychrotolerans TaxID=2697569 RepID=A0A6P1NI16_9MICC|nr:cell division protein FtsQ/DivIB [Pseudarthrobacter psychrotolerans]QHK18793.1 FtsQ-type POTRA domain-containing protein [Pseudarthrobacter psychrotolerans]
MGSPRRPTYASPGRRQPASPAQPEVISASKSAPETDTPPLPGRKKAKDADRKRAEDKTPAGTDKAAAGTDNVLAFPEPPGKRRKRNFLVTLGAVLALVCALLAAAIFSPVLAVRTVSVSGTRLVTTGQVQAALEPLKGKPLPQISDEEVSRLLAPLVQIKSVSTQARPPSGLVVQVLERVPVALVKQGEQYQLVDVDGVVLASPPDPAAIALPVIDGGAGTIGKDLFQATAAVLGALPLDVLSKLSNASAQSVDAVELKLVDGQTIIWGNAGEKELKAKVLEALLKVPADPKNPVRVYDVSAPRHPVTR